MVGARHTSPGHRPGIGLHLRLSPNGARHTSPGQRPGYNDATRPSPKGARHKGVQMPQSLSKILLHVVYSTKNREPWIDGNIRAALHAYLAGACRAVGSEAYRVGGTNDHVHIACSLPRTLTVSKLLEEIKQSSSAWAKTQAANCAGFTWQTGYGAFSLGQSQISALLRYIDRQEEHHRKQTFKEEFVAFLVKYGIDYNEEYLWD
jgi:putative transposase